MIKKNAVGENMKKRKNNKWNRKFLSVLLLCYIGIISLTGCSKAAEDQATEEEIRSEIDSDNKDTPAETVATVPESTHSEGKEEATSDNNQEAAEQETIGADDQAQAIYYGEWTINHVQAFGVGTYSGEDAESLIGKSVSFSTEQSSYFTDNISDVDRMSKEPIYSETVILESDFVANYRIPFDNLGIEADSITEVSVSDSNGYVCTFFIKDDNTLILFGGGTYFELIRKS